MYRRKNIVITVMCLILLFMAIGYAAFSTVLNIKGTASTDSKWNIRFTNITDGEAVGKANNNSTPSYLNNSATMDVNLEEPGDSMTYVLTLSNDGNLGAVVEDVIVEESGSMAIIYTISGIKIGQRLASGESIQITIKIEYNPAVTSQPIDTSKTLTIAINTVQDLGQTTTETNPIIVSYSTLREKVLTSNTPMDDSNINFGEVSGVTNGQGLYYTATNTEDGKITYYFRGNVENNYVSFANHIWRIVRINEDGSIRLVTQDSVIQSEYNSNDSVDNNDGDNALIGYKYGTVGASSYALAHENRNNSIVKDALDMWYTTNLKDYFKYLADAGFCNDRSIVSGLDYALGYDWYYTYYGSYNRLENLNQPQFACSQTNDLFTTSTSNKGNKSLSNPVGLLTADEVVYAGGSSNSTNNNYYLDNNTNWWTMSPYAVNEGIEGFHANMWYVNSDGGVYSILLNPNEFYGNSYNARPVINLKADVKVSTGDGSSGTPYVIKIEQ